ncbi:TPA: DUF2182 domain-containing protein [Enterobacter hormaechei]
MAADFPFIPARWRTHLTVWFAVGLTIAASWFYLASMQTGAAEGMHHRSGERVHHGMQGLLSGFVMWSVMMAAMMLPTVVPATSLFTAFSLRRASAEKARLNSVFYVLGYLAAWIGYCVPAALTQWGLLHLQVLNQMTMTTNKVLSVAVLVTAGVFQFTSLKESCLSRCRTPLSFFLAEWRDGRYGAIIVGLRHGIFCVACCWALMAVMFVVGTMNLLWMGLLTLLVLCEKVLPRSWRVSQISGAGLLAWAGWIACQLVSS